jgi:hypothetical protein
MHKVLDSIPSTEKDKEKERKQFLGKTLGRRGWVTKLGFLAL